MVTKVGKSYSYNADCDVCGFTFKNKDLRKRWDGFMVCKDDFETRNLADFYDTPNDTHILPWTRPAGKYPLNEFILRRNYATLTEDFTATSNWTPNLGVVTTQNILNPNGVTQACSKFTENAGTSVNPWMVNLAISNVVFPTGGFNRNNSPFIDSVYVKPFGTRQWVIMQQVCMDGSLATVSFNLTGGGSIGSTTNVWFASCNAEPNGWYRITMGFNSQIGASGNQLILYSAASSGVNTVSPDGASGFYLWGLQQEQSFLPLPFGTVYTLTNQPVGVNKRASTYQPVLDTTNYPSVYPTPPSVVGTWVPSITLGNNFFIAGIVRCNTHYIIQNNVLTFVAEYQTEPNGFIRFNANTFSLPVAAVTAGTWKIIFGSGQNSSPVNTYNGTISASASSFTPITTNTQDVQGHGPESVVITGSYGV